MQTAAKTKYQLKTKDGIIDARVDLAKDLRQKRATVINDTCTIRGINFDIAAKLWLQTPRFLWLVKHDSHPDYYHKSQMIQSPLFDTKTFGAWLNSSVCIGKQIANSSINTYDRNYNSNWRNKNDQVCNNNQNKLGTHTHSNESFNYCNNNNNANEYKDDNSDINFIPDQKPCDCAVILRPGDVKYKIGNKSGWIIITDINRTDKSLPSFNISFKCLWSLTDIKNMFAKHLKISTNTSLKNVCQHAQNSSKFIDNNLILTLIAGNVQKYNEDECFAISSDFLDDVSYNQSKNEYFTVTKCVLIF